jgi:outer membrane protein OmpA-like peptidoglycan-associated protein
MTRLFKGLQDSVNYDGTINRGPEIGQTQVVQNVFDLDYADINKTAIPDLMKIIEYLKQNKNIIVKVIAHSNQHSSRNESLKLSNQRASNVMNRMIQNGIDQARLSFQGLGHDIVINTKGVTSGSLDIESCVEFKFINFSFR